MEITKIMLKNFRNYTNLELNFSSNLNIIYGSNGSGKSNLIESIYLLALTKSFRTSNEKNLIMKDSEFASVIGIINSNEKTKYQILLKKDSKEVFIDDDRVNKMSDFVSRINIILFNPLDTKLITDAPAVRRRMLDIEISQINKNYLLLLSSYNKILKHRNAYLKQLYISANASKDYLDILTSKMIKIGKEINNIRNDYINDINKNITKIYKNIFESGELKIKYQSTYNNKDEDEILLHYQKDYRKEMEMGKTLSGIHHDDIIYTLDKNNIKDYGSVGQQKNAIISFKLSEILIIKEIKGEYPILILDDLFSELDDTKINNIVTMLNKEVQTFITTTNIDKVDKNLLNESTIFKIENGIVERN